MLAQMVRRLADFTLAGQEDQNVAAVVRVTPQLVHAVGNGVVQIVLTGLFKRPVALLYGEHAARDHHHRGGAVARFKMPGKPVRINRGGGHDDFQVGPLRQYLAQIAQQKINVQRPLVRLVNDDGVVGAQERVGLRFSEQNAVGHQLDGRIAAEAVLKPHLETDHVAKRRFQLFGNALGHRACGDAARLGVADQLGAGPFGVVELAAPHRQRDFGQLRCFARSRFTADDNNLMGLNRGPDFIALGGYGQLFGEIDG